jgi:23S rRNA pseudouridine1911/1915/1917 synthase
VIPAPESGRLDVVLASCLDDVSRSRVAAWIRAGRVRVAGKTVARPAALVPAGAGLEVDVPPPEPIDAAPEDLPLRRVYEDTDLVVVDKDAGRVVHPSPGHATGTLVHALLFHVRDLSGVGGALRPGIVHRLDKGTSGLMVVAKNDAAHLGLAAQFAAHTAGRTYLAITLGVPAEERGTVRSTLGRHPTDRVRQATVPGGRVAVTHWTRLQRAGDVGLLRCTLETGRTHQVRVHLYESGWPIAGDGTYARRDRRPPAVLREALDPTGERPMLHAWRLAFVHPRSGASHAFEAAPPEDFRRASEAAGFTPAWS